MKKVRQRVISCAVAMSMGTTYFMTFPKTISFAETAQTSTNSKKLSQDPEEIIVAIVQFKDKAATDIHGNGVQPTLDEINNVTSKTKAIRNSIAKQVNGTIRHVYGDLLNGFSIEMKRKYIDEISKRSDVESVTETIKTAQTESNFLNEVNQAKQVWKDMGNKGEGEVIAVVDSGIDPNHKDMRLSDPSKAKLNKSNIPSLGYGKYYSDKIPFAYNYAERSDNIVDTGREHEHGMHVAGISAANATDQDILNDTGVRGVAPEAQVLAMKVGGNSKFNGYIQSDDYLAAFEDAAK